MNGVIKRVTALWSQGRSPEEDQPELVGPESELEVEEKGVICPFIQYLLSIYYVTSPVLGARDTDGIEWTQVPALGEPVGQE